MQSGSADEVERESAVRCDLEDLFLALRHGTSCVLLLVTGSLMRVSMGCHRSHFLNIKVLHCMLFDL